ncbi:MAG: hypothetical protein MK106_05970 [Mariniblastus sp.]|nr:hypothetical protein [Mariniblastus sp.]
MSRRWRALMKKNLVHTFIVSLFTIGFSGAWGFSQTQESLGALQPLKCFSQATLSATTGELAQDDKVPAVTALGTNLDKWPIQTIDQISLDIRDTAKMVPMDRSGMLVDESKSSWSDFHPSAKVFAWCAPDITYQPLYFENVPLERYGQTCEDSGVAVALSAAHFFASALTLPCQIYRDPALGCEYPLGYCRPGNLAPYTQKKYLFWCR